MTTTHRNVGEGLIAGLVATAVLSLLMIAKEMMGMMPEVNVITMLTELSRNYLNTPATPAIGWIIHFAIGTFLWGGLFAPFAMHWRMPNFTAKGVVFATLAWLVMMVVLMPAAGAGFFGAKLGIDAPVSTLLLHWIYGGVLGSVYGALDRSQQIRKKPDLSHRMTGQPGHP